MLNYKTYVRILMLIIISMLSGIFIYIYIYSKTRPIPLFHRVSLDAKMMFLRDMKDKERIDTIIVGSSLGLNNLQGIVLEHSSDKVKHVLNISALGLSPMQIEQLLQLTSIFPNVKRVIYSVQFSDFSNASGLDEFDPAFIKAYIDLDKRSIGLTHSLYAFKHLVEFVKNNWKWETTYVANNTNYCLSFDRTGSVPLHMYGDDINPKKWFFPSYLGQNEKNFPTLSRIVKAQRDNGLKFYFVVQTYRQPLLDEHEDLRRTMENFVQKTQKIVEENGGVFLNLHNELHLEDAYFVDRIHLNDKGSVLTSEALGRFIDENE